MADLTLQEALELYEDECREVLGGFHLDDICNDIAEGLCDSNIEGDRMLLIGACVVWLAGKLFLPSQLWELEHMESRYPESPLRFYLDEVRAHMGAT